MKKPPDVCPNRLPFYKIVSLLPAVPRCKQGPSEFLADEFFIYENS
jgi:hypothetical protein